VIAGVRMLNGTVESIHLASAAQGAMQSVAQAAAIPGRGLRGIDTR